MAAIRLLICEGLLPSWETKPTGAAIAGGF
jgi:uncharacterized membrane protein